MCDFSWASPGVLSCRQRAMSIRRTHVKIMTLRAPTWRDCLTLREAYCYGARHMSRWLRRYLLVLIGILAVAALLYRFRNSITLEGFRWNVLAASIREARMSLLILSLLTLYVCHVFRTLRWMRFSRWMGTLHFGGVYSATLMGFTCMFLLGRAGEPIRPILIARKERLPIAGMFGVYVLERVMDAAATAVLAGLALLVFSRRGFNGEQNDALLTAARTTGALLLVGLLGITAFLIYFRLYGGGALEKRLERSRSGVGWHAKLAMFLGGFAKGLQGIRTAADLAAAIFYTGMHWLLVALIYLWVAWSFGGTLGSLTLSGAMLVLAFTMVGSALQLPGVGGGAQVATYLVFTVIFGVEKEPAAAAAILIWLITFAGVVPAGLPLLLREGWSMAELRRLARDEAKAEEGGRHISATDRSPRSGEMQP
jgi:glycosyltransferase 2 family protein